MGNRDYTSDLSVSQSYDIMHDNFIHIQSFEDSRYPVCDINVKFLELNNSEISNSFIYVLKTCDSNRFTLLTNLPQFCPVCELKGSNNNWNLQSLCTLRCIPNLPVAEEILNNLNGSVILHVASVTVDKLFAVLNTGHMIMKWGIFLITCLVSCLKITVTWVMLF